MKNRFKKKLLPVVAFLFIPSFVLCPAKAENGNSIMVIEGRGSDSALSSDGDGKTILANALQVTEDLHGNVPNWVAVDKSGDCGAVYNQFFSPFNSAGQDALLNIFSHSLERYKKII